MPRFSRIIARSRGFHLPVVIARVQAAIATSPEAFEQVWLSSFGPAAAGDTDIAAAAAQNATILTILPRLMMRLSPRCSLPRERIGAGVPRRNRAGSSLAPRSGERVASEASRVRGIFPSPAGRRVAEPPLRTRRRRRRERASRDNARAANGLRAQRRGPQ